MTPPEDPYANQHINRDAAGRGSRPGIPLIDRLNAEVVRLRSLLFRTRTGTRPDGSGCWCDPEERRNEFGLGASTEWAHTALCREITEALR